MVQPLLKIVWQFLTKVRNYEKTWGFPGGTKVKNLLANAGNTGSIPGLGRFHMPWGNKSHAPLLLMATHSRATHPQILKPKGHRACTLKREKQPQQEACVPWLESSSCSPCIARKMQHGQKQISKNVKRKDMEEW